MTDRGSFQVQAEALRSHAGFWTTKTTQADDARDLISPAVGMGDDFGFLAGLNDVANYFNTWTSDMYAAMGDASATFSYLNTALNSTANDYDGTDSTVAMAMSALEPLNNVR